jgi:hypothetical protein
MPTFIKYILQRVFQCQHNKLNRWCFSSMLGVFIVESKITEINIPHKLFKAYKQKLFIVIYLWKMA